MKDIRNKLAKLPFFVLDILFISLNMFSSEKNGEKKNSVSTELYYTAVVNSFVNNNLHFKYFRRSYFYQIVLEHVDSNLALKYFKKIQDFNFGNSFDKYLQIINRFDRVGSPRLVSANGYNVSGSSLRYLKVYFEIEQIFGKNSISTVSEIGGGYGGQALIFDSLSCKPIKYYIFDLPIVCELCKKFLNNFYLNGSFVASDINMCDGSREYDLVISNYAFSELPRNLQEIYLRKVILKSSRGYLTMNTGLVDSESYSSSSSRFTSSELLNRIPGSKIIEEDPLTGRNNYILIWGNQ